MSVDPIQQVHVPGWRIAFSGLNVALFLYFVLAWPGGGVHWAVVLGLVVSVSSFACAAADNGASAADEIELSPSASAA